MLEIKSDPFKVNRTQKDIDPTLKFVYFFKLFDQLQAYIKLLSNASTYDSGVCGTIFSKVN